MATTHFIDALPAPTVKNAQILADAIIFPALQPASRRQQPDQAEGASVTLKEIHSKGNDR